ncbi:MAG: S-4TM family putative pore-forming effector, partial [Dehalococcoidia bacterium]
QTVGILGHRCIGTVYCHRSPRLGDSDRRHRLLLDCFRAFFKRFADDTVKSAATIIEMFDCLVLTLPWNRILVGEAPSSYDVNPKVTAHTAKHQDLAGFRDWYQVDIDNLPYPFSVLLCQLSNLMWDIRLRKACSITLFAGGLVIVLYGFAFAAITGRQITDYVAIVLLPSAAAIVVCLEMGLDHRNIYIEKQHLAENIFRLRDAELHRAGTVTAPNLRQVQDRVFELNSKGPLVPNWWYKRRRRRFDVDDSAALTEWRRLSLHLPLSPVTCRRGPRHG